MLKMALLSAGLVVIFSLPFAESQVIPANYSFTDGVSMNGSSATGHCSSVTNSSGTISCTDPTSSVLYDEHIPTLTGLDGDMWASQLLTLHTTTRKTDITFDFRDNLGSSIGERVEVVLFNCPKWGIKIQTIRLSVSGALVSPITPTITSCDSLVRVCLQAVSPLPPLILTLNFTTTSDFGWVHLAEVTFYDNGTCPTDTVINTSMAMIDSEVPSQEPSTPLTTPTRNGPTSTNPASTGKDATSTPIIPVAVAVPVTLLLLLVVVVMAAVFTLWRCKHHTSHHTAKEEASHTTSHTHPPAAAAAAAVSLCEEMGQVHYASLDQDTHTYASIPPQASKEKQEAKHPQVDADMMYDTADLSSALYSSIAETKTMTLQGVDIPKETSRRNKMNINKSQLSETSPDQLYAQVDKKSNMSSTENLSPQSPDPEPAVDQLYAQVHGQEDMLSSVPTENPSPQPSDSEPPVQLYALVDKKGKKKSKEKEVCAEESGAAYSVVNKLSSPQLPPKSQLLLEELA